MTKEHETPSFIWLGRKPCGHAVYVAVDCPDMASEIGKHVATLIRDGRTVDRIPFADYRKLTFEELWKCECPVTPEEQKIRDREAKKRERRDRQKRLGLPR